MKKIYVSLILLSGIVLGACSSAAEQPRGANYSQSSRTNGNANARLVDARRSIELLNAAQSRNLALASNPRSKRRRHLRRKNIEFPRDCDYLAGGFRRERACAAALEMASRDLPKDCDCDYDSSRRPDGSVNLIEFNNRFADAVRFYRLSSGKYLVQVRCATSAYNVANLYLLFDETRTLPKARTLKFPTLEFPARNPNETPRKTTKQIIGGRRFDPKTKELTVFVKGRGLGDFGEYARYAFPNGKPRLKEFRARLEEGGAAYETNDVLLHSPKKWRRYYP